MVWEMFLATLTLLGTLEYLEISTLRILKVPVQTQPQENHRPLGCMND